MREWYSYLSRYMMNEDKNERNERNERNDRNDRNNTMGTTRATHVTMISPKNKKYQIPPNEVDGMFDIYSKFYMDTPMGMLEQSGTVMPVVADIDFKNEITQSPSILIEEIFQFDFIVHIASLYRDVLAEILDISGDDLYCFKETLSSRKE